MSADELPELLTTEEGAKLVVAALKMLPGETGTTEQIKPLFDELYEWAERIRLDQIFLEGVLSGDLSISLDENFPAGHEDRFTFRAGA